MTDMLEKIQCTDAEIVDTGNVVIDSLVCAAGACDRVLVAWSRLNADRSEQEVVALLGAERHAMFSYIVGVIRDNIASLLPKPAISEPVASEDGA